jgi:Tol biopolymer transport system component
VRTARRRSGLSVLAATLATVIVAGGSAADASAGGATNGLISYEHIMGIQHDSEIWGLLPDGSGYHQVTFNRQNDRDPAWSPDGQYLAFASSGADMDIWVKRATRRGEVNLTNNPDNPDLGPSWSPDGTRIVFWRQNFDQTGAIWVMDADGGNQTPLTDDLDTNMQPAWSPDGSTIVFVSNRDGNLELYRIDPDGSDLARITNTPGVHEENPDWSPDGSRIAYDSCDAPTYPCPGSANYDVFTIDPDGTDKVRLTTDTGIDANPSWAPDGTKIAFRCDRPFTQICVMDSDGSDEVSLTPGQFWGGVDPDWGTAG